MRSLGLITVAILSLIFWHCAPKKPQARTHIPAAEPVPEPEPEPTIPVWQNAVEQSVLLFDEGVAALDAGDYALAMSRFDEAVLEVLDCRSGLEDDSELRQHLQDLIGWIHELEVEHADREQTVAKSSTLDRLLEDAQLDFEDLETQPALEDAGIQYDMPVVDNQVVRSFIDAFTTKKADIIGAALERSTKYLPMIRKVFREQGLPLDLAYLPVIESAYIHDAHSRADAVGMWQFVDYVGRHYGLVVDWWVDQRQDPEKATLAAALYFKDLYRQLDDWNLVLCAYNYGPGRVARAVRRGRTKNFWELSRRRLLPRETRGYVPAYMAALKIAKNPRAYGFANLDYQPPQEAETVAIDFGIELDYLAGQAELPANQLSALNTALVRGITPTNRAFTLRVPPGSSERFREVIAAVPDSMRIRQHRYVMRRGDTLSALARQFETSVGALMRANEIRNPRRLRVGTVLLIPMGPEGSRTRPELAEATPTPKRTEVSEMEYRVRRGDSLYRISKMFETTIPSLLELNPEADPLSLQPGQRLRVMRGDRYQQRAAGTKRSQGHSTYTVARGDTLSQIARRFGLSTTQLLRANGLSSRTTIFPGQKIKVPREAGARVVSYRVKRGDTLTRIAGRFRTSVAKLMEWNRLRSSDRIVAGQTLLIYR